MLNKSTAWLLELIVASAEAEAAGAVTLVTAAAAETADTLLDGAGAGISAGSFGSSTFAKLSDSLASGWTVAMSE